MYAIFETDHHKRSDITIVAVNNEKYYLKCINMQTSPSLVPARKTMALHDIEKRSSMSFSPGAVFLACAMQRAWSLEEAGCITCIILLKIKNNLWFLAETLL